MTEAQKHAHNPTHALKCQRTTALRNLFLPSLLRRSAYKILTWILPPFHESIQAADHVSTPLLKGLFFLPWMGLVAIGFGVGMFPLILVLNRDSSRGVTIIPVKDC